VNRRQLLLAGAGTAVVVVAAPYAWLSVGGAFERHVAGLLGVEHATAASLLTRLRRELGDAEYDERARKFALATRWPSSVLLPEGERGSAVRALLLPLLEPTPSRIAYVRDEPMTICRVVA
jgi:hypothetical protein